MNQQHHNLQQQTEDLMMIIEHFLALLEKINRMQDNLQSLPAELDKLKACADILKLESSQKSSIPTKAIELKLDIVTDNLEITLNNLATVEYQINNALALKERLEAIQEARISTLTPERIHNLLTKRSNSSSGNCQYQNEPKYNNFSRKDCPPSDRSFLNKAKKITIISTCLLVIFGIISVPTLKYQELWQNGERQGKIG